MARRPSPFIMGLVLAQLAAGTAGAVRVRLVDHAASPLPVGPARDGWLDLTGDSSAAQCVVVDDYQVRALPPGVQDGATVVLDRGATLAGHATLPDGRPAAGVAVRYASHPELGTCAPSARADDKGSYRMTGLLPGMGRFEIVAPDGLLVPQAELSAFLDVRAPARLDLRVHEAVRLHVAVRGATGPLAAAAVRILPEWTRFPLDPPLSEEVRRAVDQFEGASDATGSVVLPPLPRRAGWRMAARHAGFAPSSTRVDLRTGSRDAAIAMVPGGTIALRAVDSSGATLPSPRVRFTSQDAADADLVPAPPAGGSDGTVRIGDLPAGTWLVELRADGARPRAVRGVVVRAGRTTNVGDVVLEPGVSVAGVVTSAGSAVAGARVTLRTFADGARLKLETTTDAAGRFELEGLDPSVRCDLRVQADGFAAASRENIEPDGGDVAIELERTATLVAEIRGDGDALPEGVAISLGRNGADTSRAKAEPVADEPSSLRVAALVPGTYTVIARAPRRAQQVRRDVELRAGEETRLQFELPPGRTLAGHVVDAVTHAPIASARVAAPAQGAQAETAPDGGFVLEDLAERVSLEVSHPAYQTAHPPVVDLGEGAPEALEIALDRGGAVEGVVQGADGAPTPGAEVSVLSQMQPTSRAVTDTDGHYRIDGLAPGPQHLMKADRAGTYEGVESVTVTLVAGQVVRQDFGGRGRLVGVVTHDGEPARGARLALVELLAQDDPRGISPFDAPACTGTSDDAGRYILRGVDRGEHGLTVTWQGHSFGRQVSVASGVQETRLDIEVPNVHLAGRVVERDGGAAVVDASVTLQCGTPPPGQLISTMETTVSSEGDVDMLDLSTRPEPHDSTTADGSFFLLVPDPEACKLSVYGIGFEPWASPDAFTVASSRDDVVVQLVRKDAGRKLHLTLHDDATHEPLEGTFCMEMKDGAGRQTSSWSESGYARTTLDAPPAGGTAIVIGWATGHAPMVREGIALADGQDAADIDMSLGQGGELRLLLPDDAPAVGTDTGLPAGLHLVLSTGFDLAGNVDPCRDVTQHMAVQARPGEWVMSHLPLGPMTVSLGTNPGRVVEVVAGETREADLR